MICAWCSFEFRRPLRARRRSGGPKIKVCPNCRGEVRGQ